MNQTKVGNGGYEGGGAGMQVVWGPEKLWPDPVKSERY